MSYPAWRNRARRWLTGGHREVGELLDEALKEQEEITPEVEAELAERVSLPFPATDVSRAIADAIVFTGTDETATRS
eukprot:4892949-Lingulodinium_polyedra.AAC.1